MRLAATGASLGLGLAVTGTPLGLGLAVTAGLAAIGASLGLTELAAIGVSRSGSVEVRS